MKWRTGGIKVTGKLFTVFKIKPVSMTLRPSQIPYMISLDQNWACTVRSHQGSELYHGPDRKRRSKDVEEAEEEGGRGTK
jgi:hypothetical protein